MVSNSSTNDYFTHNVDNVAESDGIACESLILRSALNDDAISPVNAVSPAIRNLYPNYEESHSLTSDSQVHDQHEEIESGSLSVRRSQDAWNRATLAEKRHHETLILLSEAVRENSNLLKEQSRLMNKQMLMLGNLVKYACPGGRSSESRSPLSSSCING